jgi:hypothetical protein
VTALNLIDYYNPELSLFPEIARRFAETKQLDPEALYLILDWKASRARTTHLDRLKKAKGAEGSFEVATRKIAAALAAAVGPKERMGALMSKPWEFRLATASAILAVLYSDDFTIYDARVCKVLRDEERGDFDALGNRAWSDGLWDDYQRFTATVCLAAPSGLSLRDCDRWLWGKSRQKQLAEEIASKASP